MKVTITHNEIKKGARGDYLYIKYTTEKGMESGKAIFQPLQDKWGLCQNGAQVELKLDSQYNIIDILTGEKAKDELSPVIKLPIDEVKQEMTKGDWQEKDAKTRKSIERQKSLELAVEVAKMKGSDSTEKIIATAKIFESYLEGKEVKIAKGKLIEEANRLNAM